MKRREFVRALTTLPLAGSLSALAGPMDRDDDDKRGGSTLAVFLHGPFAVILNAEKKLRLTAYVPFDPQKEHQFAFQMLQKPIASESSGKVSYQFSAGDDFPGANELPYIDHGFDDFTLRVPSWKRDSGNYFVSLDLPLPNVITYIPPAEGVEFVNHTTGMMPIQHILEYKVRDWKKVRLRSNQKLPEGELKPIPFEQLYKEFKELWESKQGKDDQRTKPRATQQKDVENFLAQCAERKMGGYFFGVGLPHTSLDDARKKHAIRFFNEVLLPTLGRSPEIENKRLLEIGDYGPFCTPTGATGALWESPRWPGAHLLRASLTDDCRLGGIIGTCC